ncbi:hypothetical protein TNCV_2368081 [Trichonephila clavipes]|nr:hypothetical protein TNCV_2368081 [Trichonephila clavipes]
MDRSSGVLAMAAEATPIRATRSFTIATDVSYTSDFMQPQKKQSKELRFGEHGGQAIGPSRPIYLPGYVECRLRPTTGVYLAPSDDKFRGPRSDYVRQVVLATTPEICNLIASNPRIRLTMPFVWLIVLPTTTIIAIFTDCVVCDPVFYDDLSSLIPTVFPF